jgi:serine/threonine protein kinase
MSYIRIVRGKCLLNNSCLNYLLDGSKKELGRGGFAEVWLCTDVINDKEYAIKEICITPQINKETIENELKVVKEIGSEHGCSGIVYIYDSFEEGERYYIVMEYCKKGSLLDFLKENGKLMNEEVYCLLKLYIYFIYL